MGQHTPLWHCGGIVLVVASMLLLGAARFYRACEAGRCQQLSVVKDKGQSSGAVWKANMDEGVNPHQQHETCAQVRS